MDRRGFLKSAAVGIIAAGLPSEVIASNQRYNPSKVDPQLFETINKVKNPKEKTPTEKKHAPIIKAPEKVKAGEPFNVEVYVGEIMHDMAPKHWIQYIELNIGNEPAGRLDMQPNGYLKPKVVFTVVLGQELVSQGKVTLVANERCNLHGYWESSVDIAVTA